MTRRPPRSTRTDTRLPYTTLVRALLPNTGWLEGSVERSPRGEIVIDDRGHTSVPGVLAAGDCTTVPYKQIVIAMGAGSTAALSAFDHLIRTPAPADVREPALA